MVNVYFKSKNNTTSELVASFPTEEIYNEVAGCLHKRANFIGMQIITSLVHEPIKQIKYHIVEYSFAATDQDSLMEILDVIEFQEAPIDVKTEEEELKKQQRLTTAIEKYIKEKHPITTMTNNHWTLDAFEPTGKVTEKIIEYRAISPRTDEKTEYPCILE